MDQGVVKTYDPVTGIGIVVRDADLSEVLLRPGSLEGSVFRTLRQGQRILFDPVEEGEHVYVSAIRLGQDGY
jgi:cold shock CspA family protein